MLSSKRDSSPEEFSVGDELEFSSELTIPSISFFS
jgi:hypothetical protein